MSSDDSKKEEGTSEEKKGFWKGFGDFLKRRRKYKDDRRKRTLDKRKFFETDPVWRMAKWGGRKMKGGGGSTSAPPKQKTQKIDIKTGEKKKSKLASFIVFLIALGAVYVLFFTPFGADVRQTISDRVADLEVFPVISYVGEKFTLDWFQTKVGDIASWRNPDAVSDGSVKSGVFIEDFRPVKQGFPEDKEIMFEGRLVPRDLYLIDDAKVKVECGMFEYDGVVTTRLPEEDAEGEAVITTFRPDDTRYKSFKCIFPNGMSLEGKEERTVRAFVNITSDSEVKTDLRIYVIREEDFNRYKNVEEIFHEKGDLQELQRQGLWKGDGEIYSREAKSGPIELSLGMGNQPYYGGSPELRVRLHKGLSYATGSLSELRSLTLRLPIFTQINPENNFRYCPYFEGRGNTVSLKQTYLNHINTCTNDCGFNKDDMKFSCELKVNIDEVDPRKLDEGLSQSWIKATADYSFESHKLASARIGKASVFPVLD